MTMTSPESATRPPLYRRKSVIIPAIVVGIAGMALAWWLLSPLFLNSTVVEDFPTTVPQAVPETTVAADADKAIVDAAEDVTTTEPTAAEPTALVTGEIMGADSFHQGSGTATIYQLDDGSRVLRLESLDVTNGPDLHVYLTPVADPQSSEEVNADGYIDLGALKGNRGDQNYEIPSDYELPDELSVVIYCVPFHVIFSTATLGS